MKVDEEDHLHVTFKELVAQINDDLGRELARTIDRVAPQHSLTRLEVVVTVASVLAATVIKACENHENGAHDVKEVMKLVDSIAQKVINEGNRAVN